MQQIPGDFVPAFVPYGSGPGRRVKFGTLLTEGIHMMGTTKEGIYLLVPHNPDAHAMSAAQKLDELGINNSTVSGRVLTNPLIPVAGGIVNDALRTLFEGLMDHPIADEVKVTAGYKPVITARMAHADAH